MYHGKLSLEHGHVRTRLLGTPEQESGSPSDSQDLESSLSDVSEAMEQSAMINELQGELESLKKENEELKAKNKMIEDIQHESKEEMEKVYGHFAKSLSLFRNFRDNEKVREMEISRGNKS